MARQSEGIRSIRQFRSPIPAHGPEALSSSCSVCSEQKLAMLVFSLEAFPFPSTLSRRSHLSLIKHCISASATSSTSPQLISRTLQRKHALISKKHAFLNHPTSEKHHANATALVVAHLLRGRVNAPVNVPRAVVEKVIVEKPIATAKLGQLDE